MSSPMSVRKVFEGTATRKQMFSLFDRHAKRPRRCEDDQTAVYAGEWFEIAEAEFDYMLELLPPLWIRGSMFAMREFLTGSVTSIFFALRIDGMVRHFHGYCDLSDNLSVDTMRLAIIDRERQPVRAMTREERLDHIWSTSADAYRGYAGDGWPRGHRGKPMVLMFGNTPHGRAKLLDDLTDDEIAAKLPVHLRRLPGIVAA